MSGTLQELLQGEMAEPAEESTLFGFSEYRDVRSPQSLCLNRLLRSIRLRLLTIRDSERHISLDVAADYFQCHLMRLIRAPPLPRPISKPN